MSLRTLSCHGRHAIRLRESGTVSTTCLSEQGGREGRSWEDAVKYGFISGGGGDFYVKTLGMLSPGDLVGERS